MTRAKEYSGLCTAINEQMSNLFNVCGFRLANTLTVTSKGHLEVPTDTVKINTIWPLFCTEMIYPYKNLIFHTPTDST